MSRDFWQWRIFGMIMLCMLIFLLFTFYESNTRSNTVHTVTLYTDDGTTLRSFDVVNLRAYNSGLTYCLEDDPKVCGEYRGNYETQRRSKSDNE